MTEYTNMNGINNTSNTPKRRSLFVETAYSNGTVYATLMGPRIGEREAAIIANSVNNKLRECGPRVKHLVLDFSEIQFVSSLGLGMCIDVRNTAEQCKADTSILGLTAHLKELFEMMRLDRLFTISGKADSSFGSAA
ncbi:MAG: STAS domain-containing protein [Phycisphaerales bacterium]|jgi:anti-anti-sigma factor|nr:STAS domain-containing protein [Phycisphaerales bacterium]